MCNHARCATGSRIAGFLSSIEMRVNRFRMRPIRKSHQARSQKIIAHATTSTDFLLKIMISYPLRKDILLQYLKIN